MNSSNEDIKDTKDEKLSLPLLTVAACIVLGVGCLDPQWGDIHSGGLGAVALVQDTSYTVRKIICIGAGDRVEYTNISNVRRGMYVKMRKVGENYELTLVQAGYGSEGATYKDIPGSFFSGNPELCTNPQ